LRPWGRSDRRIVDVTKTVTYLDMYAAAYALAAGAQLLHIIPDRWFKFVFRDDDGTASRALGDWSNGRALVQARYYAESLKQIRRMTRDLPRLQFGPDEGDRVSNGAQAG